MNTCTFTGSTGYMYIFTIWSSNLFFELFTTFADCGTYGQAASGHLASVNLCYYIFNDGVGDRTWDDAKAYCTANVANGRLAVLLTATINTFVGDLLDSVNGEPRAWFGLSKPDAANGKGTLRT